MMKFVIADSTVENNVVRPTKCAIDEVKFNVVVAPLAIVVFDWSVGDCSVCLTIYGAMHECGGCVYMYLFRR